MFTTNTQTMAEIRGIEYQSKEEYYFLHWCFELVDVGIFEKVQRAQEYELCQPITHRYQEGKKIKQQMVLRGLHYTPDYEIVVGKEVPGLVGTIYGDEKLYQPLFCTEISPKNLIIECKGSFDYQNMTRLFKHNQKIMFSMFGLYVNLVEIPKFFDKTFYPESYFYTEK